MSTVDLGTCPYFDDVHTERVEAFGSFYHTFEFSIPANHESAEFAKEKNLVVFPDLDGDVKCFTIATVSDKAGPDGLYKRCKCDDSAQDELNCWPIHFAVPYSGVAADDMLTDVLAGTRWQPGIVEALSSQTADADWKDYPTAWACVLDIARLFSLEPKTRVEVVGNLITARYVDLLQRRGTYTGLTLSYAGNTSSVERLGDGGQVYTAMYGLGKADTNGDPLTFTNVVWTVLGGDPIDKPDNQAWVGDPDMLEGLPADPANGVAEVPAYGIPLDGGDSVIHRFGVFRDPDETDAGHLLDKTYADWNTYHRRPQYSYDVAVVSLERMPPQQPGDAVRTWEALRIGDTVGVRNTVTVPPYSDEARVSEVRRCYSDPTKDAVVLGPPRRRFSSYIADNLRLGRKVAQQEGIWTGAA